jgi:hypothetical protein
MHIARKLVVRSTLVLGLLCAGLAVLGPGRAASASPPAQRVAWVELDRSGGITGSADHFTVLGSSPHPHAPRLMRAAGSLRFGVLSDAYPDDPCCDRFQYVVAVHYRDGATKTVSAVDGAPDLPAVLREVIDLTAEIGAIRLPQQR